MKELLSDKFKNWLDNNSDIYLSLECEECNLDCMGCVYNLIEKESEEDFIFCLGGYMGCGRDKRVINWIKENVIDKLYFESE